MIKNIIGKAELDKICVPGVSMEWTLGLVENMCNVKIRCVLTNRVGIQTLHNSKSIGLMNKMGINKAGPEWISPEVKIYDNIWAMHIVYCNKERCCIFERVRDLPAVETTKYILLQITLQIKIHIRGDFGAKTVDIFDIGLSYGFW